MATARTKSLTQLCNVKKMGRYVAIIGRWVAKLVARLLATATLFKKWATEAKEWTTHSSPPKKIYKNIVKVYPLD
jgi:hypothetical protein